MMEVMPQTGRLNAAQVLTALLGELGAVTDYRTLRDTLPRRLAHLLHCRCVVLYQRYGDTLQFVSGSFDDKPGWSSALLAVTHINPVSVQGDTLEAQAWRQRRAITGQQHQSYPTHVAAPLLYRMRGVGVLVAIRGEHLAQSSPAIRQEGMPHDKSGAYWTQEEAQVVEAIAGVVAMLLENTRLLERDRDRIQELSLLNSISRQFHASLHNRERVRNHIIQRAREISSAVLCECILSDAELGTGAWLSPALQELVLHRLGEQSDTNAQPLIIERPGDTHSIEYLAHLDASIKTFFAIPLWSDRSGESLAPAAADSLVPTGNVGLIPTDNDAGASSAAHSASRSGRLRSTASPSAGRSGAPAAADSLVPTGNELRSTASPSAGRSGAPAKTSRLLGAIVGAYHRPWKLRREEIVLLTVLANQASSVMENIALMAEVMEARNEARKLLRQVLDDQHRQELILESIPSGLLTIDLHGRITTCNRAAATMLDCHAFEATDQPVQRLLALHTFQQVIHSEIAQSETLTITHAQGQEHIVQVMLLPFRSDQGELIGVLATLTDMTTTHRLEEEKRRLDRLASLGEMAANVAHEVRNPLASIKTSMQIMLDDLEDGRSLPAPPISSQLSNISFVEGMHDAVKVVLDEVDRLDAIVRELLQFSRPGHLHRVKCSLAEICDRVLHMLEQQCIEADILVHHVSQETPMISVDISQIEQVLLNLVLNALQAMTDGGVLTISLQHVKLPEPSPNRDLPMREWLELSINDTGIGIAREQLERIFQPFFTTKAHGIGLGLPISRRLVEDHQGQLLAESQLGFGSTFTIRLPLDDQSITEEDSQSEEDEEG